MTHRSQLVLVALAIVACGKRDARPNLPAATPTTSSSSPAATSPATLAAQLEWVPSDSVLLVGGPPPGPLGQWLLTFDNIPLCAYAESGRVDRFVMFTRAPAEPQVSAFHVAGKPPTPAGLASCANEFIANLGIAARAEVEGRFVVMTGAAGGREHLTVTDEGWILQNADRARLEQVLARNTRLSENDALVALLARVETHPGMWVVGTTDLTTPFLGVPSRAVIVKVPPKVADASRRIVVPVEIVFASPDEATRARGTILAKRGDQKLSAAAQSAVASMKPEVVGAELHLDLAPLFADMAVMEELQPLILPAPQQ